MFVGEDAFDVAAMEVRCVVLEAAEECDPSRSKSPRLETSFSPVFRVSSCSLPLSVFGQVLLPGDSSGLGGFSNSVVNVRTPPCNVGYGSSVRDPNPTVSESTLAEGFCLGCDNL